MKKITAEKFTRLFDDFNDNVAVWCKQNGYSLHQAFEESRKNDKAKYETLSGLWSCLAGREYLRSYFRSHGGRLRL